MSTQTQHPLARLGWNARRADQFQSLSRPGTAAARVAIQQRGQYTVLTERGERTARPAGRLLAHADAELPVVGDWVVVTDGRPDDLGVIEAILPRTSRFSRKTAGFEATEQVLAANIDLALIVTALEGDLNLRRLERYLVTAWEGGSEPLILLSKSDLCDDVAAAMEEVSTVAAGAEIHPVSAVTGEGIDYLRTRLSGGLTAALLGSSGVGKSSIVNCLLEKEVQRVAEIREDGKGRHTTTHRELILLPEGGILIDTPGMRELQMWDASDGLEAGFDDISALAAMCKFRDCTHESEPGCAVLSAIETGELGESRFQSYKKLQREIRSVEIRKDKRALAEEKKRFRQFNRERRRDAR